MDFNFLLAVMVLAISCTVRLGTSTSSGAGSSYGIGLRNNGAFRFPVYHRNHTILNSWIQTANIPEVRVIADDSMLKDEFFMAISLGTPAVLNFVLIDTGSSLSWVQCQHCDIQCYEQVERAGPIFNPFSSSTYRDVSCSAQVCTEITSGFGCYEEKDTCLYRMGYAMGEYSVGYLGKDKLTLDENYTIDDFIFGCGAENVYSGHSAGIFGFSDERYSFFNQVAQHANYKAFSYCFPSKLENEGFLSVGSYVRDESLKTSEFVPNTALHAIALSVSDIKVNGIRLEIEEETYERALTVVDSGTPESLVLSPIFYALDKAATRAMIPKGYARANEAQICFVTTGDQIDWNDFPTVEMTFDRSTLMLQKENLFYVNSVGHACMTFLPNNITTIGYQILGNRALRSFEVVYDVQERIFGFRADAC